MNRQLRILIVLAVLFYGTAGCGGSDASEAETPTTDDAASASSVGSLPVFPREGEDPAIGMRALDLNANTLDGGTVSIFQEDGRGKVFIFLAHWCPHCQAELPMIVDYINELGVPDNVDFYAVSTGVDPTGENYPPTDWFIAEEYPFPVLEDSENSDIAMAYGLPGWPFIVVVGGDGLVVKRVSGSGDPARFDELVLLAEANAG